MPLRLIRAADLKAQLWKNGGGVTREIAVSPEGARYDRFDWRFSMAEVEADGPFSAFSGVDRTLVLIDGAGFDLDLPGGRVALEEIGAMISFGGESPAHGHLRAGAIRDFNVMTRRGAYAHAVQRISRGACTTHGVSLLLAHAAPVATEIEGEAVRLERLDALLLETACRIAVSGDALLAEITPLD